MHKCLVSLVLLLSLLTLCATVQAQDTFVDVTDVVGGVYHLPLANCPTQGLTYTRSTNSFGCVSGSSVPAPGSNTQVVFNDSGVLGADAGFTYVKATDTATLGALVLTTPLPATSGGTGFASFAVGDLLYANAATTLAKLADVAAGSYLRSGGVTTAPVWSTATLPNTATTGDVLYASASNVYSNLAAVAAGAYLRSGGVTTAPVWSTLALPNAATTGDVLYASASNVISALADVAAGSYLRSGGVASAPVWSTTTLPNSATTGDLLYASASNIYSNLADVATGSVLISGGVTTAPNWSTTPTVTSVTLTGSILLNNNVPINSKDNAAATQSLLSLTTSNNISLGYSGAATLFLIGGTSIDLYPGASANGRLTSTGLYLGGAVSATDILNVSGQAARIIGSARHTTAATAGNTLTLKAGGAVSGGSNLAGGNLILVPGVSTGSGTSLVNIQAYPGTAGATADNTAVTYLAVSSIGGVVTPAATQTIAAGNTIAADSCGGVKRITAAGAVSTDTTNPFTAPAAANTGCVMMLCNIGTTNAITLKRATLFFALAGADVVLLANSCIEVINDGTIWRQSTALLTAS